MKVLIQSAIILPLLIVSSPGISGQAMKEAWFPDGEITWRGTDFSSDFLSGIRDAAAYLNERTPLELRERASSGELEISWTTGLFDGMYGGMTKGYRNSSKKNKLVRISSEHTTATGTRNTLLHEFGHVLGFTHEFQREDREANGVTVCGSCSVDPFNFDIVSSNKARMLSPYDFESRFATGYTGVTPTPLTPSGSLLSVHDINSIYRVYSDPFDGASPDDHFGAAVAAGDFDGDGIEDIAVASVEGSGAMRNVQMNFFKGVATAENEDAPGATYMPWFRHLVATVPGHDSRVALATGELKERAGDGTITQGRDDIDELVVGLPGAFDGDGEIHILTVNAIGRFRIGDLPWGGKGVLHTTLVRPVDIGLSRNGGHNFGAAVLVANLSGGGNDDLVVGAPGTIASDKSGITRGAGSVAYLPEGDAALTLTWQNPSGRMRSKFGSSLSVLPGFHNVGTRTVDALIVGAPEEDTARTVDAAPVYFDAGAVYVYEGAINASGVAIEPTVRDKIASYANGQRFGTAVVGFLTNGGNFSWFPEWQVLVGGPGYTEKTFAGGKVSLYAIDRESAGVDFLDSATMPGNQGGAEFGAALAVHGDSCSIGSCPRNSVWIGIGAPKAKLSGDVVGVVYRWDVWKSSGDLTDKSPTKLANGSPGSDYGSAIATVRRNDRGGFLIGAPQAEISFDLERITAGMADVRMNKNFVEGWTDWRRQLTKSTRGDMRPENM